MSVFTYYLMISYIIYICQPLGQPVDPCILLSNFIYIYRPLHYLAILPNFSTLTAMLTCQPVDQIMLTCQPAYHFYVTQHCLSLIF